MILFRTVTTLFVFSMVLQIPGFAQKKTYHCRKTEQIIEVIQENHFEARTIDQAFNNQVNQTFVQSLDQLGMFFTADDVEYITAFCPDLTNLDCADNKYFMDYIVDLFRNRINESEVMMKKILLRHLTFLQDDTLFIPKPTEVVYPATVEGLGKNMEKYLRFQLLRYYISAFRTNDSSFVRNKENMMLYMDELKADIQAREMCKISHLLNYPGGFDEYIFSIYLNVLTSSFDPHTNYFSMNDKEQFESAISRNKNSFGADLEQNDDGEIVVTRLIPGGPAWRSGEMRSGDVLLSIRFPGKAATDLICSSLSEIQDLIYNAGSDHLEVTFRSVMGQVKTIELKIESLAAAENTVYSFILEGDSRVGYISLPGFYTDPEQKDPLGCAADMVQEIRKLMDDGIEGLILDVRNNGGGSIVEAVDLAGVFLNAGPLCIYDSRYEKPTLIKDLESGTRYDGPLILLVNGYSASASEILAGMLKDYNRALIVGTPTFGKASGQIILPLSDPDQEQASMYYYGFEPTDFIKITTTKYYRLNGHSHQASGMQPDIVFPEHVGFSRIKESQFPSAFARDSVHKDVTFEPGPPLPVQKLNELAQKRINDNPVFGTLNTLNDSIRPLYEDRVFIPLKFENFYHDFNRNHGFFSSYDSLKAKPGITFNIRNNSFNQKALEQDAYKEEIHREVIKNLGEDYPLEEAYRIMSDLIAAIQQTGNEDQ